MHRGSQESSSSGSPSSDAASSSTKCDSSYSSFDVKDKTFFSNAPSTSSNTSVAETLIAVVATAVATFKLPPSLAEKFPVLARVMAEKLPLKGNEIAEIFFDDDESDVTEGGGGIDILFLDDFTELLRQGFCTKKLFQLLYSSVCKDESYKDLDGTIHEMRQERLAFLAPNKDERKRMFKKKQFWYYIPSFVRGMIGTPIVDVDYENAVESEEFRLCLSYKIESNNAFEVTPWLAGLLYEFCSPFSIVTSSSASVGTIGKIKINVKIITEMKRCAIDIRCPEADNFAKRHAVVLASAIINVVSKSPILNHRLNHLNIVKVNKGSEYKMEWEALANTCDAALKDFENDIKNIAESGKEQTRKTQKLMREPENDKNESNAPTPSSTSTTSGCSPSKNFKEGSEKET